MSLRRLKSDALHCLRMGLASLALMNFTFGSLTAAPPELTGDANTTTPIKHVIVIIGENRTFDHVFATYQLQARRNRLEPCSPKAS